MQARNEYKKQSVHKKWETNFSAKHFRKWTFIYTPRRDTTTAAQAENHIHELIQFHSILVYSFFFVQFLVDKSCGVFVPRRAIILSQCNFFGYFFFFFFWLLKILIKRKTSEQMKNLTANGMQEKYLPLLSALLRRNFDLFQFRTHRVSGWGDEAQFSDENVTGKSETI